MSDRPMGEGWWQASDLRWYPPDARSGEPYVQQPPQPQYGQPPYGQPQYGQPAYGQPNPWQQPQPPQRKNSPVVLFVVIGLVILAIPVLAGVVVFAVGGVTDTGQLSACKIESRTLRTAEAAWRSEMGEAAGYATIEQLTGRYLEPATWDHRIELSDDRSTYELVKTGKCADLDYEP